MHESIPPSPPINKEPGPVPSFLLIGNRRGWGPGSGQYHRETPAAHSASFSCPALQVMRVAYDGSGCAGKNAHNSGKSVRV